jgi:hypothetical protein
MAELSAYDAFGYQPAIEEADDHLASTRLPRVSEAKAGEAIASGNGEHASITADAAEFTKDHLRYKRNRWQRRWKYLRPAT